MKHLFAATALTLTIASPLTAGPVEDYTELREDVWQDMLDDNPTLATSVGDRRGDGQLGDLSMAAYDRNVAEDREFLARLNSIDESALPEDLRVDYAILKSSLEDGIEGAQFDQTRYVLFTNRGGWFSWIASLPYSSPLFTKADYESYVARLEAYGAQNEAGIARSREAVARGLTQACGPMEGVEDQITGQMADSPEESGFWRPFEKRPSTISEADWAALQARARAALTDVVFPAYEDFLSFYTEEYAPECRTGLPGVAETANGDDYYAYRVRSFTTTDMTPDQIHQLGLSEVARIRAEMEEVAAEAGFDTREAFVEHLRTDPQYYMTDEAEYERYVGALAKQIDGWMPKLFGTLPRQPYTVQPIPAAQAPGNTTAYYEPGSLETGQAGIYRINLTELDQRPLWELPALGVHEAVPGHHHQIALQQELDLHPLRRNGTFFTAFVEGWGLYSERLGIEMGLYDTPAKQMGRLSYEMWRATRLVVDTGIHSKGWTKQQAVDFMTENTALSAANIDAEVNRYITWPGQALAYKIGELKIRELRGRAEEALGDRFDLRAFHDAVLENGAVPLDVLEEHIDRWIAEQREG
ncbi:MULTISPECIES: DUF885 domain-containing protein [Citromicrobium]|uniref:DUF885 domain-containing protein n=1 Tax=Citromicrobium TaxID=72173 RepID=UPI0001DD0FF1|nr:MULTISPECIES: DUF885 domain-containing protein [Citromicrobium]ALG61219.1 hypothetical protein WG74_10530 [Citromicrobium sp. JL477]KPM15380.1 hypothetical protein VO58_09745 [Citromicrobium sp. JL1351]KPM19739.1 hypothetical protein VM77_07535 [Citromicrobium sp. JL31]KPM26202.1 hypothetical protein VO57_07715 [Citromicrobium sp. JL2201]